MALKTRRRAFCPHPRSQGSLLPVPAEREREREMGRRENLGTRLFCPLGVGGVGVGAETDKTEKSLGRGEILSTKKNK